jgi:hypothetical protein
VDRAGVVVVLELGGSASFEGHADDLVVPLVVGRPCGLRDLVDSHAEADLIDPAERHQ